MATCWYLPGYTPTDRDPITHEILPGAMPPGIYCEDEACLKALLKGATAKGIPAGIDFRGDLPFGVTMGGTSVYVATPAQAEFLRTIPETTSEPEPAVDPMEEISAKLNAMVSRMMAEGDGVSIDAMWPTSAGHWLSTTKKKVTPHPLRIPAGMNRAARRAAASRGRA